MQTESNIQPASISVERCGDMAEIIFCEDITEGEKEGEIYWAWDEYRLCVPYRENLLDIVSASPALWLAEAKIEIAPTPTLAEQVAALTAENEALRNENNIIAEALEETIAIVMGGE